MAVAGKWGHLGRGTGTRSFPSLACCFPSQPVLSAHQAPRKAGCTALCWRQLAEPPGVLGPRGRLLVAPLGEPQLSRALGPRLLGELVLFSCGVCAGWSTRYRVFSSCSLPTSLLPAWLAHRALLWDAGRVPPPVLAGSVSPVFGGLSSGWWTWALLPWRSVAWSVACPPRGGLLPPGVAQGCRSPGVQAQQVTRLLPARSPGSCFSTGPESPVWKSHGVGLKEGRASGASCCRPGPACPDLWASRRPQCGCNWAITLACPSARPL